MAKSSSFCTNCGISLKSTVKFCGSCGTEIEPLEMIPIEEVLHNHIELKSLRCSSFVKSKSYNYQFPSYNYKFSNLLPPIATNPALSVNKK